MTQRRMEVWSSITSVAAMSTFSCPSGASTLICSRKSAPPSPGSARNAPGRCGSAAPAAVESRLGDLRFGQLVAAGGHDRRVAATRLGPTRPVLVWRVRKRTRPAAAAHRAEHPPARSDIEPAPNRPW